MALKPTVVEIDPAGDTLFILRNADAHFAVDSFFRTWSTALPQHLTHQERLNEQVLKNSALANAPAAESTPEIHMRLSSKHLTLASTYFQKLTANGWEESKAENGYSYTVTAQDWDKEALIILMNIIHGQTHKVPLEVDLEKLAKIAVLVDYYNCHKAVNFYAKVWTSRLDQSPLFESYSRELLLRLFVSYTFSESHIFTKLTKTIIYESRGPIHTLGLPIPKRLVDKLDEERQQLVFGFISHLEELKTRLSKEEKECSFECLSMSLGALIKGMKAMRLHDPQPIEPFYGYSVSAIEKALCNIKIPEYSQPLRHGPTNSSQNMTTSPMNSGGLFLSNMKRICGLDNKTKTIINLQQAKLKGLRLGSFAVAK